MPEYDAFGREIGEDTLADTGLGISSGSTGTPLPPPPPPQPLQGGDPLGMPQFPPPPPPPTATQQAAESGFRDFAPQPVVRKRSGMGCGAVGLVLVVGVVGAIAWGVIAFVGAVEEGVDSARDFIPTFPTITAPGGGAPGTSEEPGEEQQQSAPAEPAEPPTGLGKGSMIKRANFAKAMSRLRAAKLGNLRSLRVAPERIDAQLLTKGGALRNVQVQPSGNIQRFGPSTPGLRHLDTFSYSSVNPAAPERLVRQAAKRLRVGTRQVDYLVMINFSDEFAWAVFFKNGANFQADRAGRITRRVN